MPHTTTGLPQPLGIPSTQERLTSTHNQSQLQRRQSYQVSTSCVILHTPSTTSATTILVDSFFQDESFADKFEAKLATNNGIVIAMDVACTLDNNGMEELNSFFVRIVCQEYVHGALHLIIQ